MPRRRRRAAGLVWAHGGGFVAGDLDMPEADWVARTLAERGVTVVSVDYRLAGDGCRYPAPSDDVLAAWRWTLANADRLGIDPAAARDRRRERRRQPGRRCGAAAARRRDPTTYRTPVGASLRPMRPSDIAFGLSTRSVDAAASRPPLPAGVFLAYPTLLAVQPAPDAGAARPPRREPRRRPLRARRGALDVRAVPRRTRGRRPAAGRARPGRGIRPRGLPARAHDQRRGRRAARLGEVFAASLVAAGVPLELVVEPGTVHGHLNRPDEPAASASIDRVVRWIARLADPPDHPPHHRRNHPMTNQAAADLIARSNRLGADPKNTNYAGGNTSAKGTETDPVTGEPVELLWVKGSGGDLGTLTEAGLAVLRLDRLRALVDVYPGVDREDEMVAAFDYTLHGKGGAAPSIDTAMHGLVDAAHVDHLHPDSGIAIATSPTARSSPRRSSATRSCGCRGAARLPARPRHRRDQGGEPAGDRCILGGHGITAWGDTSEESEQNSLWIIDTAAGVHRRARHGRPVRHGARRLRGARAR
jgi:acetyl esterase/lipase